MDEFTSDLHNDWNESLKCPLSISVDHSNELYDIHKIASVENVLCLRVFSSSLYEIVNATNDGRKLMVTIFEEKFLRKIEENDIHIYEAIAHTVPNIAWKIRKADILTFRRTSENHSWPSVRDFLINLFPDNTAKLATGMFATILQNVHHCHSSKLSIREEAPLLPKSRFNEIFRVAFLLFNDAAGEYILKRKKNSVYETIATRLVYFYTRLAADTWRILVTRNGPKVQTEWYMTRSVENIESESSRDTKQQRIPNTNHNNIRSLFPDNQNTPQSLFQNQANFNNIMHANQKPLRRQL